MIRKENEHTWAAWLGPWVAAVCAKSAIPPGLGPEEKRLFTGALAGAGALGGLSWKGTEGAASSLRRRFSLDFHNFDGSVSQSCSVWLLAVWQSRFCQSM